MSVKVTGLDHNPNYSYKDQTSKVNVNVEEEAAEKEIKLSVTAKNTTKKNVSGHTYALLYNGSNELIGVKNAGSFYLKSKATETISGRTLDIAYYPGYDHYEIVNAYYSRTYK